MSSSSPTVFIGLDGATFTVLDPLMDKGVMPNLRAVIDNGTRAILRSVIPPLTPPAWTSMMTGKRPGEHGVFDFFQKESVDSEYFQFSSSQDVQSATIWSLASDAGKRIIALNFPLMFPPPEVNGSVVPGGWIPWKQLRLGCFPPGLFDRLKRLPTFNAQELAFDMTLEAKAIEGCAENEYADWIRLHERREERWLDILQYLMAEEPSELVAIMFDGVDKLQHLCWRFLDAAYVSADPTPWETEIIGLCEEYFRGLDTMIGRIVDLAGPSATILLGSDHGFGPTEDIFYVNSWLEREGYLAWAEDQHAAPGEVPMVGFGQMTRHVYQMDWSRTRAYAATPSSQAIHIVTHPQNAAPLSRDEYLAIRDGIVAKLGELRSPRTGNPFVVKAWTKDEAFAGPFDALAPDITLTLDEGAAVSILRSDEIVARRTIPLGNHRWDGIFVAAGPTIRRGDRVDEISLLDLAPTILYSLGVPIPDDVSGRLPESIFKTGVLAEHPPVYVDVASRVQHVADIDAGIDEEAETTILKRLRALGYVE